MVSDQEIASCVESLLRHHFHERHSSQQHHSPSSGPGPDGGVTSSVSVDVSVSVDGVVRQLEAKLGLDLSHKAAFIRDQIDLLLLRPAPPPPRPRPPPPPPSQKDHFALAPNPQFQPYPHHPYHFPHLHAVAPSASSSPYSHLPHHHEISFRCPSPFPGAPQQQQQQQLQEHAAAATADPIPAAQAPAQKESAPTGVKRKGGSGGLTKVCGVSPELQAIVGQPTMARTEIVKQLWAYIRKNNLQDPNNKRRIICNDELRLVFETDCTDMFKMNKLLSKHIIPLEPTKEPVPHSKKLKSTATEIASSVEPDGYSVIISDALAKFFRTRERQMLQSEAFRRLWDYIKRNQLEDPTNAKVILCDSRLQQLFGCEMLSALGVSAMLSQHLFKQS